MKVSPARSAGSLTTARLVRDLEATRNPRFSMSGAIALLVLSPAYAADYTGDGIDDLVVGLPFEQDIDGILRPGAIHVLRGSRTGLTGRGDGFFHQDSAGISSSNAENDYFGYALGAGDVDGDGDDDIIVGGPGEESSGVASGALWRLELESVAGVLGVATSQLFSQATRGVTDIEEEGDGFGRAFAVDDFNGDGYDDVVVGIPYEDLDPFLDAGAVHYFPGGPTGLTATDGRLLHQDVTGALNDAETSDLFGRALAAGDFDADGYADLAIGVAYEDRNATDEGAVHVMYGSTSGPGVVSPNDQLWSPGVGSAAGTSDTDNLCGESLAVGDFDGDGYDDLAIGCPGYDIGTATAAGAVLLVYGSATGLDASEIWSQDTADVYGSPGTGEEYGGVLSTGDYDGDGYDDLAIGVPLESYGRGLTQNGVVQVLMGSVVGITADRDVLLAQDAGSTVEGTPDDYDFWGQALASGDYDDDGLDDLAVGAPYDADPGSLAAGVVNVFYGSATGPSTAGDQIFHQDTTGVEDSVEGADYYGHALR
jgi:hypothetical protein